MMGRFVTKHPQKVRQQQRLMIFCREIKKGLLSLCVDNDVPIYHIDDFMEEFFFIHDSHEPAHCFESLLTLLIDDRYIVATFEQYRENI